MENGAPGEFGALAVLNVEEELKKDQGSAINQHQIMEALTAKELK